MYLKTVVLPLVLSLINTNTVVSDSNNATVMVLKESNLISLNTIALQGEAESQIRSVFSSYVNQKVAETQGVADQMVCNSNFDVNEKDSYFWCWDPETRPSCDEVTATCTRRCMDRDEKVKGCRYKSDFQLPCWYDTEQRNKGCPSPCGCQIGKSEVTTSILQTGTLPASASAGDLTNLLASWGAPGDVQQEFQSSAFFERADFFTFSFFVDRTDGNFDVMLGSVRNVNNEIALGYLAASSTIGRIKRRYKTKDLSYSDWDRHGWGIGQGMPYHVGKFRQIVNERGLDGGEIERLYIGSQNVAYRSLLDKI